MQKVVFATCQVEGFHCWADAPEQYEYLRHMHRHMFHIRVEVSVSGDNRDVEFIHLKHRLVTAINEVGAPPCYPYMHTALGFGSMSCEMIAVALHKELAIHNYDITAIEVSEDGENGARITY